MTDIRPSVMADIFRLQEVERAAAELFRDSGLIDIDGMAVASLSPSTRHAQGELSNAFIGRRFLGIDERGAVGATVVLAVSGFCMFGIALLLR